MFTFSLVQCRAYYPLVVNWLMMIVKVAAFAYIDRMEGCAVRMSLQSCQVGFIIN